MNKQAAERGQLLGGASRRPAHALTMVVLVGMVAQACAANDPPGSHSATVHSCSPNYTDENKLGRLSVQQKGPGTHVHWGAYPKLPADWYVVDIFVGSKQVDGKRQNYPPHGSLPPRERNKRGKLVRTYRPGQIFKITGTSYDAKGGNVVQRFYIKCRLV